MKQNYAFLYLLIALILAVSTGPLRAQVYPDVGAGVAPAEFERVGSAGFQFLKLPTNAQMAAMGGVMSSLSRGDAAAAFTNPASTADVQSISAHFSQMSWIADIDYMNASVVKNMGAWGNFGLSFVYVDYGDMIRNEYNPIFDESGAYTFQVEQQFDMGTFSASDVALGLSYGRNITDRLQFGASFKYIQEKIDDAETSALGIDIGTVYYTGLKSFRIAMVGRNFGPDTEFLEWSERIRVESAKVKLPMTFILGGAIDILEGGEDNPFLWTVAGEFVHTNDASEKINVGSELGIMDLIKLRAGYRFNYDEEGLTLGAGLRLHTGSTFFTINYAYVDFGRLDTVNMFSVSFGL